MEYDAAIACVRRRRAGDASCAAADAPRAGRRYRSVAPKDINRYAFMEGFKLLLSESAEVGRMPAGVRRDREACIWP
jgi:hypothetical protein